MILQYFGDSRAILQKCPQFCKYSAKPKMGKNIFYNFNPFYIKRGTKIKKLVFL